MSNRIWSDEAIEILEKFYPIKTMKEMQELLPDYTPRQINRRAKYMELRKKEEVKIKSRLERSLEEREDLWSDDEKKIIIQYYRTEGAAGVQKRLEKYRPLNNIKKIANRMGITKENQNEKHWEVTNNKIYEEDGQLIFEVDICSGGIRNGNDIRK